ncbi:hypothetical protein Cgig2_027767 [Carnegiea gigantea]|uniref:Uncharacterized protein n=1 Tax=Carnegiea gigantea TaxID=171969 RepID=A0A9Q1GID2_9CARY|nr:hypothetical protein Cgig2_027767 [Carnegiea gigantea]
MMNNIIECGAVVSEMGGCIGDHPQTRLRLDGKIIELSDDDEISIAFEDKLGKKMDKHKQDILKWKNGLVHLIETHDIKTVDGKTGWAVGGDDLDDNYNRYILPPTNGRQLGRPPSKHRESQMQGTKPQRCSKYGEVGHTRRTCRNPHADFEASYEGNVVEVKDLLNGSLLKKLRLHSRVFRNSRTSSSLQHGNDSYIVPNCGIRCGLCSYWVSAMTPPQPLFAL